MASPLSRLLRRLVKQNITHPNTTHPNTTHPNTSDSRYQAKMKRKATVDLINSNKLCKELPKTWVEKVEQIEPEDYTLSIVEIFLLLLCFTNV
jgi:hypothetical protein